MNEIYGSSRWRRRKRRKRRRCSRWVVVANVLFIWSLLNNKRPSPRQIYGRGGDDERPFTCSFFFIIFICFYCCCWSFVELIDRFHRRAQVNIVAAFELLFINSIKVDCWRVGIPRKMSPVVFIAVQWMVKMNETGLVVPSLIQVFGLDLDWYKAVVRMNGHSSFLLLLLLLLLFLLLLFSDGGPLDAAIKFHV